MHTAKKWLAILLSLLMMAASFAVAVAEEVEENDFSIMQALADGREVNYKMNLTWHDNMFLDTETNSAVKSLLDSLEVHGRAAYGEPFNFFGTMVMDISGEEAFNIDYIMTEDGYYYTSPIFSQPFTLRFEDLQDFADDMGKMYDNILGLPEGSTGGQFESLFGGVQTAAAQVKAGAVPEAVENVEMTDEEIKAAFAAYGLDGTMEAMQTWLATDMVGDTYEGPIGSMFGVETKKATLYPITKEKLIAMLDAAEPTLVDNEVFWQLVVDNMGDQSEMDGEPMTAADFMEKAPEAFDKMREAIEKMSDDAVIRYNECYDDKGEHNLGQFELFIPGGYDEYGSWASEVSGYAEWVPGALPFYAELKLDQEDGMTMLIEPKEDASEGVADNGFTAVFDFIEYGETAMSMVMATTDIVTYEDDSRLTNGAFAFTASAYGEEYGIDVVVDQKDTMDGDDIVRNMKVDFNINFSGIPMPLISMDIELRTAELQDPPFDVAALEFADMGKMDEAEIEAFMESCQVPVMQTGMRMMSLLPEDAFKLLMEAAY